MLRTNFVRNFIKRKSTNDLLGPSDEQRNKATSLVWGQATNAGGKNSYCTAQRP
ncbi:MAG: hypothetical protein IPP72_16590 [Chitinophagaceae bacterium]|nr:hypothetical protein [Chitinophagaceae bacterium]